MLQRDSFDVAGTESFSHRACKVIGSYQVFLAAARNRAAGSKAVRKAFESKGLRSRCQMMTNLRLSKDAKSMKDNRFGSEYTRSPTRGYSRASFRRMRHIVVGCSECNNKWQAQGSTRGTTSGGILASVEIKGQDMPKCGGLEIFPSSLCPSR